MKMKMINCSTILFITLISVLFVNAEIISVSVTGVVNSITTEGGFELDGSVFNGVSMSGLFSFDTQASDISDSDWNGKYEIHSVAMSIGNYNFMHNPSSSDKPLFTVFKGNAFILVDTLSPRFDGGAIYDHGISYNFDEIDWKYLYLELMNLGTSDQIYIPTTDLPSHFPDISVFDIQKSFDIRMCQSGIDNFHYDGCLFINGEITSIAVVPEPCVMFLLMFGSLIIQRKNVCSCQASVIPLLSG